MSSIAGDIRAYALGSRKQSALGLTACLVDSFLNWPDWDVTSLWSVQWRTFALLVAEAIETDGSK